MFCKTIFYKIICCLIATFTLSFSVAQVHINCEKAATILPEMEKKITKISTTDPEVITLHALFVADMLEELAAYDRDYLPNLHYCEHVDFYQQKHHFQRLKDRLLRLQDTLAAQRQRVDTIFYQQAAEMLQLLDTNLADYYTDRALEFNRLHTDALIMKTRFLFSDRKYDECIEHIHILYNEAPLTRQHENELSDFTALFYDHLFNMGDSLVKIGHAADALPVFLTLETFCHDMPSSYCNDDYYRGIIRSKTGVYESYLTIARVAFEKQNYPMAYKFLDDAEEYYSLNEETIEVTAKFLELREKIATARAAQLPPPANDSMTEPQLIVVSTDTIPSTPAPPAYDSLKHHLYQQLFTDALFCFTERDTKTAWKNIVKAIALEDCSCFPIDPRVRTFYHRLCKKLKKTT